MSLDDMGAKERAWFCAGYGSFIDTEADESDLYLGEGERPVLALCPADAHDPVRREKAFGWAISDLCEQSAGWLTFLRRVLALWEPAAA